MQAKLEEWNKEIDVLAARADGVTADARNRYNEQVESLKAKRAGALQKLDELQRAGESAWEDLKSGLDLAWAAMGEAIDSAKARFR
jgi:hypothetical protein